MSTYNTLGTGAFHAKAISWTVEGGSGTEPAHGTLVLTGEVPIVVGSSMTIDGDSYIVTNVTTNKQGSRRTTTVLVRDSLYEALLKHANKNIVWMTAPARLVKGAELAAVHNTVTTEIRAKPGSVFGEGGWLMSEVVAQCATIAGISIKYGLPDFQIKQLELNRGVPIVSFLISTLAAMLPMAFMRGSTLYLMANNDAVGGGGVGGVVETEATSVTMAEPFARIRVSGGLAAFRADKWEGATLLDAVPDITYAMSSTESVTVPAGCGTRTYRSVVDGVQDRTIVDTVYGLNAFAEDSFVISRTEWSLSRKVPVHTMSATGANEAMQAAIRLSETAAPSDDAFFLQERSQVVNRYAATGKEWDSPLLLETHTSRWKYLWWSAVRAGDNPPAAQPFDGFPPTMLPRYLGVGDAPKADILGVLSKDAYYEQVKFTYERMPGDAGDLDYFGGLLLEKNANTLGVCSDTMRNIIATSDTAGVTTRYDVDKRVRAAYRGGPHDAQPDIGYRSDLANAVIASSKESWREVSYRVVEHVSRSNVLEPDAVMWFDFDTAAAPDYAQTMFNYKFDTKVETIPYGEAPQSIVQERGMQCYSELTGSGSRVVDITIPCIISWKDISAAAAAVFSVNPHVRQITTYTVTVPGRLHVLSLMGSGSNGGRVVAASYTTSGDGAVSTQVAIQTMR